VKKNYQDYIDYGFVPEQLVVVPLLECSENKNIKPNKHYMKFQKAKK